MNTIIPTPYQLESLGLALSFSNWRWDGPPPTDAMLMQASAWLDAQLPERSAIPRNDELRICLRIGEPNHWPADIRQFLEADPLAREQGYALVISPAQGLDYPIATLSAFTAVGAAYGLLTLAQLVESKTPAHSIPAVRILDKPDFRYRGVTWNIFGEIGQWSHDWGDGIDAFRRRVFRAFDIAFHHKLNLLNIDGIGWNPERFPGYGALMRELALAARQRNIRLLFAGYGAGYGAGKRHNGPVFLNRRNYPDGEIYPCYVKPDCPVHPSNIQGNCLSNAALRRLKQDNLREFVTAVEPGALYIHHMDWDSIENVWQYRCADCRRRWPNDDLYARDGMAGAFAEHYDALAEAVFSVRNAATGYDAARDCLCVMVSPGYAVYEYADDTWDRHVPYWAAVSRFMKHVQGVQFGVREQCERNDGQGLRLQQLADAIRRDGQGHGLSVIAFCGGDGFYNDLPFCAGPVMNAMYAGAETVLQGCGHAFQEPLQLLCAEYGWRSRNSAFYNDGTTGAADVLRRHIALRDGYHRPPELFGPDGFLDEACRRLYGTAGHAIATIQRTFSEGENSVHDANRNVNVIPGAAISFPDNCHQWISPSQRTLDRWQPGQWALDFPESEVRLRAKRLAELAELDLHAAESISRVVEIAAVGKAEKEYLAALMTGYRLCGQLADLQAVYFGIYADAQADITIANQCVIRLNHVHESLNQLERAVKDSLIGHDRPLDYLGGANGNWLAVLQVIRREIEIFTDALHHGERGTPESVSWW